MTDEPEDETIDYVGPQEILDLEVDCLVVGGVADGVLMRVKYGAEIIELGRPTHVKPLTSPYQTEFETEKESDVYTISIIHLPTETGQIYPFSIAVVQGHSPAWAAKQLSIAYVAHATEIQRRKAEAETKGKLQ